MEKVKVMIVDDQYIARQLFEMYIKSSEKYKLVMQVDSAALATKALKGNPVDLILMDILMSDGSNGLSAACEIKKFRPEVKIIAVTSMPETSWLTKMCIRDRDYTAERRVFVSCVYGRLWI